MKFWNLYFLIAGGFVCLCSISHADPLSGEEREALLAELNNIEDVLDGKRLSTRTSAVQTFQAAAASDKAVYEFYLQCHKTLKFDARDASFSDFRKWREQNEDRIKTKSNLAAMRLQLQYLVLTLRAAEGVKKEIIVPELEKFVENIVAHAEDLGSGGMRTLQGSVKSTIFAEAYNLNKSLEIENWSFSPARYSEVYEKTIFPYYRETAPDTLASVWDRRIKLEKNHLLLSRPDDQLALTKFKEERLPNLYWQKAKDIYQSYSEQQGAKSMLELLRANPNHPDITKWVDDFRKLLTSGASTAPKNSDSVTGGPSRDNPLGFEN